MSDFGCRVSSLRIRDAVSRAAPPGTTTESKGRSTFLASCRGGSSCLVVWFCSHSSNIKHHHTWCCLVRGKCASSRTGTHSTHGNHQFSRVRFVDRSISFRRTNKTLLGAKTLHQSTFLKDVSLEALCVQCTRFPVQSIRVDIRVPVST